MRVVREVLPEAVSAECQRRILGRYSLIDQLNAPYEGTEADMRQWIEAMRDRNREIKAMTPIPFDYIDDKWWAA